MLKLFNTLSASKEDFKEIHKGKVSIYTCGPTVYNFAHIGNFRSYILSDLLRKYLIYLGFEVRWVMNITDIDDKTIRDSKIKYPDLEPKKALKDFCDFYEEIFFKDLEKLNINKNDFYSNPKATIFIEEQKELVQKIYENGFAYVGEDDSVYFDIGKYSKAKKYGVLVNIDFDNFKQTERIQKDEYEKESVSDFVLWKGYKTGEPCWEFELGGKKLPGRPGWHLECSAMEEKILGLPFDIHTGGKDLKFPHHENEICQSMAGYGLMKNNYFFHIGFLNVEGEKMSKSKNNFYILSDILAKGYNGEEFRFSIISNHYLEDFNFTENGLNQAKKNLEYIRQFFDDLENKKTSGDLDFSKNLVLKYKKDFEDSMNDDLNSPKAIASIFEMIKESRNNFEKISKETILEFLEKISFVFGVSFKKEKVLVPDFILDLAKNRMEAKKSKDFEKADFFRKEIEKNGYNIKDTREGFEIEKI